MPTGVSLQSREISVLVCENTRIHSHLLAEAISQDRELRILGAVSTAAEFLTLAARCKPDVVVLSTGLDDDSVRGLATLCQFHTEHPDIPAVALLDSSRREIVLEAFRCGARGIFSKNESLEQLRKCVRSVYLGQVWANSREVRFVLEALSSAPSVRTINANGLEILTAREREVVLHLAEGMTNREIGERMRLSPHTIKNHVLRIFDKLGVSNRIELLKLTLSHPATQQPVKSRGEEPEGNQASVLWCKQGAERGAPYAQLHLAELYRSGEDVPRDLEAAYYWYCLCEKMNPETFAGVRAEKEKLETLLSPAQIQSVHVGIANTGNSSAIAKSPKPARNPGDTHEPMEAPAARRVAYGD
jgi:DNA-binding NarL/FixJ family response regulator